MQEEQLKEEIEKYFRANEELSFEKFSEEAKKIYDKVQDEKIVHYKPIEIDVVEESDSYDTEVSQENQQSSDGFNDNNLDPFSGMI